MAFDLKIHKNNGAEMIQLIDSKTNTIIEILSKGALMNSWKVYDNETKLALIVGNDSITLNHHDTIETPSKEKDVSFEMNGFRSGKMSPFSCRIENGQYNWGEQNYQFNKFYLGDHAMHGLVYDANFTIRSTKIESDSASVELEFDYKATDPGFPFDYQIFIEWTLYTNNQINVKTEIQNKSKHALPIMDGWHPYFSLGGRVDDYELKFNSIGKIEMNKAMIPTGNSIDENFFNDGQRIDTTHFDDCYKLNPLQNEVTISYEGRAVTITPKSNYPYLQIYTPDDRQSIAIENLSGAPNCFNNKMGLQILEPHDQIYFETTYQFKSGAK
jgi:aldose 1-epimerase